MKNSTIKEIQSLFETGEIETIKFSKTGKVSVKYVKEPYIIQHAKSDNVIEVIKEYAEIYKSLEKSVKKSKLKINFHTKELQTSCKEAELSFLKLNNALRKFDPKQSKFERFYDVVGKWLGGGKSFATNELKTFA